MMRAEKVAGDIGEAHETISGSASPIPTLASLLRRLERKAPDAGGLLDGALAPLGRAIDALQEEIAAMQRQLGDSHGSQADQDIARLKVCGTLLHAPAAIYI